jgi:hypothetical protein
MERVEVDVDDKDDDILDRRWCVKPIEVDQNIESRYYIWVYKSAAVISQCESEKRSAAHSATLEWSKLF